MAMGPSRTTVGPRRGTEEAQRADGKATTPTGEGGSKRTKTRRQRPGGADHREPGTEPTVASTTSTGVHGEMEGRQSVLN